MNRTGTVLPYGVDVALRQIAFMDGKAVLRISLVVFHHDPVPRHLGDNRSRRNRRTLAVAVDDGLMRHRQVLQGHGVNEDGFQPARQDRLPLRTCPASVA